MNTTEAISRDLSLSRAAVIAGVCLLFMAILGPFANFMVLQKVLIPGDASETLRNLEASAGLFRTGTGSFMLVAILDIIVAWALYILMRPVHTSLALLTAWFRVVYATIFGAAIFNLIEVVPMIDGAASLAGWTTIQRETLAMSGLTAFQSAWNAGLIVFSLHLLGLGYLVFRSGYMPKYLGILLIIAFLGYFIDGIGTLLFSSYDLTLAMYTFIGEVVLIFWLLIQGRKLHDIRGESA